MRLGPFELVQPLATGGMSEVWSAYHAGTGVYAAVKVIPPQRVDDDSRRALQAEIRTAAALDHPGIVWVYDQGTIDHAVAAASGGRLLEGSPYLVMEFASYSLRDLLPIHEWAELRSILVGLLDALAHAHARGVIHRDLKPGNVLVCGPDDLRPGLKLTDFGIAHALDTTDPVTGARKVMGTPRYMAPEQVDADWRALGPSTDLYSLGCLLFRCLTGHGPFRSSGTKLLLDHLRKPPPPLPVLPGFPPDLASWAAWLLEKDPARRPSSAAAALEALPPGLHVPLHPGADDDEGPTTPMVPVPIVTLKARKRQARRTNAPLPGLQLLPVPADWKRPSSPAARPLRDTGRALLGLRPLPMVGRLAERDLLWTALRQGANRGEPVSVGVFGHAGLGRSRLLGWFAERADELGCAFVFTCQARPQIDLSHTLRRNLEVLFKTSGLDPQARVQRARHVHARLGIPRSEMVELALDPSSDLEVVMAGLLQLVDRLKDKGPVLLTFDDLHHQPDLLRLVQDLLQLKGPVVVVVSAQDEALADDPMLRIQLVDQLSFRTTLQPLEGDDWTALVHSVLPLGPTLAATIEQRTRGNPRFAVELLTDWVRQDALIASENGFEAPADLDLPPSLQAIWSDRLRELLAHLPEDSGPCLELAATLGMEVDHADLRALLPGREPVYQALFTRLGLARLVEQTLDGFAFCHPALREVILDRAERAGRAREHHRRIARHLEGATDPRSIRRRGRHRAAAGQTEAAFTDLYLAARQSRSGIGIAPALVLLEEAERLLTPDDPRLAEVKAFRARTLLTGRQYAAARTEAEEAHALARLHDWPRETALALVQLGVLAFRGFEHTKAQSLLEEALSLLVDHDDPTAMGIALSHLGWVHVYGGRQARGMICLENAASHYDRQRDRDGQISRLMVQVDRASFLEDWDAASEAVEAAWALSFEPPQLMLQLHLLERRAYIASRQQEFPRARRLCEQMLDMAHALSAGAMGRLRVLFGHVALELDDPDTALASFQHCANLGNLSQSPLEEAMVYAGLVACFAVKDDPDAMEAPLRHVEDALAKRPLTHPVLHDLLAFARRHTGDATLRARLGQVTQKR